MTKQYVNYQGSDYDIIKVCNNTFSVSGLFDFESTNEKLSEEEIKIIRYMMSAYYKGLFAGRREGYNIATEGEHI